MPTQQRQQKVQQSCVESCCDESKDAMKKIVLITGSSRGIGAETAYLAAQAGWVVAVNYQTRNDAAQAVLDKIHRIGGEAMSFQADLGSEAAIVSMFESIDRAMGSLGYLAGLVNNAGIVASASRLDGMTWARSEQVFRVNMLGAMACAREAAKRMSTSHGGNGGSIVNVSSAAAKLGSPNQYIDYAMSKAALEAMSLGLAKELASESVRVNTVRPGLIDTEIHTSGGDPGRLQRLVGDVPMQRIGSALEVARAIVWLLSDESSYCTASVLDVTGGR